MFFDSDFREVIRSSPKKNLRPRMGSETEVISALYSEHLFAAPALAPSRFRKQLPWEYIAKRDQEPLVASLLLVVWPRAPSFLLLVATWEYIGKRDLVQVRQAFPRTKSELKIGTNGKKLRTEQRASLLGARTLLGALLALLLVAFLLLVTCCYW